jgi:hypothetical protein
VTCQKWNFSYSWPKISMPSSPVPEIFCMWNLKLLEHISVCEYVQRFALPEAQCPNLDQIHAELVTEGNLQKWCISSDIGLISHFVDECSLQASRHIQMMWIFVR